MSHNPSAGWVRKLRPGRGLGIGEGHQEGGHCSLPCGTRMGMPEGAGKSPAEGDQK